MSDHECQADDAVRLGPLQVRAESDRVAVCDAALALFRQSLSAPLTFPGRWLALPEIRAATDDETGPQPINVPQAFDYLAPVVPDVDYLFRATIDEASLRVGTSMRPTQS